MGLEMVFGSSKARHILFPCRRRHSFLIPSTSMKLCHHFFFFLLFLLLLLHFFLHPPQLLDEIDMMPHTGSKKGEELSNVH
uniref:Uncharacterized protein n=1 Tax=Caenorhabditis japonica TaxID=281687 RepID=A0A8R1J0Q8_CAEJA